MSTAASTGREARLALYSPHKLKLGFFGPNMSSGLAATTLPERWDGSWEHNLALAQMLDDAGIDFLLPVGRWKGYGGATNFNGHTFETVTWACGLLAQTKRITVFGTVHAPLVHPVFAAKQFVTADHIGRGRFGLNIVCGWNQDEFDMFGVQQREHDTRYAYGEEWLGAIRRIWEAREPFDVAGDFIKLRSVEGEPKPYGGTQPVVMNAGSSDAGKAFAIAQADYLFVPIRSPEQAAPNVADAVQRARVLGKEHFGVFTTANIVCRPTKREADAYYQSYAEEHADWPAVDHMVSIGSRNASTTMQPENYRRMRVRFAAGYGGWPIVGDPDDVAAGLAQVSALGFTGVALGLVNYLDEFPYFRDEVLPRLQRLGLRESSP